MIVVFIDDQLLIDNFDLKCCQVRMQVDLSSVAKSESLEDCLHAITFTLISGTCLILQLCP